MSAPGQGAGVPVTSSVDDQRVLQLSSEQRQQQLRSSAAAAAAAAPSAAADGGNFQPVDLPAFDTESTAAGHCVSLTFKERTFLLTGSDDNFSRCLEWLRAMDTRLNQPTPWETGDSDEDEDAEDTPMQRWFQKLSEDMSAGEQLRSYMWNGNNPVHAKLTSWLCSDGVVAGNWLLLWARRTVRAKLDEWKATAPTWPATLSPMQYYIEHVGEFAKYKPSIDVQSPFTPASFAAGWSKVRLRLDEEGRLFVDDDELKSFLTRTLDLEINRWDLPYRGYTTAQGTQVVGLNTIMQRMREKLKATLKSGDKDLAFCQLHCILPGAFPIHDAGYGGALEKRGLRKFFDFFNALVFGVEASRNNLVFWTGLQTLLDVRHGTVSYDSFFSIFPLAVTGTARGTGNFVAEQALYQATEMAEARADSLRQAGARSVGFRGFPQQSKCYF